MLGGMLAMSKVIGQTEPKKRMAVRRAIKKYWVLYLMALPGLLWYLVFKYIPMPTGLIIAMEKYVPWKGLWGSEWVWFDNFKRLFESEVLWDLLKNTLLLSALSMIFAFPSSIILALLINELRCRWFKRSVQTVAYLPYFLSWAIVAGLAFNILDTNHGLLNQLLEWLGKDPVRWNATAKYWPVIITITKIWKECGWGTIIFLAAICSADPGLYEASTVDGANRWQQTWNITIPAMMPTITVTFILSIGKILKEDFEMIYAMVGSNDILWETMDVFETWVYRTSMSGTYSTPAAMSLLQNIVTFFLVWGANTWARRRDQASVW